MLFVHVQGRILFRNDQHLGCVPPVISLPNLNISQPHFDLQL